MRASPESVRIEIAPPVSSPALARRLIVAASLLAIGTFVAVLRLSSEWHQLAMGRGNLPPGALGILSLAVLCGAPAAFFGLAALFFAEETLDVRPGEIVREIALFGRGDRLRCPRDGQTRLVWTNRPVAPWWTWTFRRLAIVHGPQRIGIGATLGNSEKSALASLIAPLIE